MYRTGPLDKAKALARQEAVALVEIAYTMIGYGPHTEAGESHKGLEVLERLGYKPKDWEQFTFTHRWEDDQQRGLIDERAVSELKQRLEALVNTA